ncbi:hypothetical protein JDS96_30110 [Bacillus cereus group sp. N21]|nr:hypothetical protein [Bacillus cereus group sp. N21]
MLENPCFSIFGKSNINFVDGHVLSLFTSVTFISLLFKYIFNSEGN